MTEPAKIRWPKAIVKLTAKDFNHGYWSLLEDDTEGVLYTNPKTVCGTRCCAVGWVVTAFGECASPDGVFGVQGEDGKWTSIDTERGWDRDGVFGRELYPEGSPVYKFSHTFAKNLGADMELFRAAWSRRGLFALSNLFEDGENLRIGKDTPTETSAAKAWNKTLKDLGYTEETEVSWA